MSRGLPCKFQGALLNYGASLMKGTALALLLLAPPAGGAPVPAVRVSPPPGWAAAPARSPRLLASLKGPETSSFQLARARGVALDNPGAVRLYLGEVLRGIRAGTRRDFRSDGRVERREFRNGLVAHLLRAELDGKPRLVIALADAGGVTVLATLQSAAPEAMLAPLLEAVEYPRVEGAVASAGAARSLDGQLEVALGGGLRSRALTERERRDGFTLAMQGAGSELLFQRLDGDSTPIHEQAAIVRAAAGAAPAADPASATPAEPAPTAAGPVAVYSWARLTQPPDGRFAVGFLPWGYSGYSLLARGPSADGLLVGVLAALKAGPSAAPGIVDATPAVPLEAERGRRELLLAAGAGALALLGLAWSRSRKNATVSP